MQLPKKWAQSAIALGFLAAGSVWAQAPVASELVDIEATTDWRVQLTPYVWGTGLSGSVRPLRNGPTGKVDESFSDVLKDLDAVFFLNAVVRKEAFVMSFDVMHASLSKNAEIDVMPGLTLGGQAKMRQRSWTALAGYNWQASPKSSWDWLAGVRHWSVRATVRTELLSLSREDTVSKSATDPVVAARWRYQWDDRWSTLAYMDIGGRSGGSQRTLQTLVTVNYALQKDWHLSAGYRYLNVKYDKDGTRLDFSQQGPVIGVSYRF